MKTIRRAIAVIELLLILPATMFMTALFVKNLQPIQYEPAHAAQWLVNWFSLHLVLGLYLFLMAMPMAALILGFSSVLACWRHDAELREATLKMFDSLRPHLSTLVIACSSLVAGGIMAIVALHMIAE